MANNTELIKQCEERAQQWLTPSFDEETRKEEKAMLYESISEIYGSISF